MLRSLLHEGKLRILSKCEKARLSEIYRAECGDERQMQPHARTPGRFDRRDTLTG